MNSYYTNKIHQLEQLNKGQADTIREQREQTERWSALALGRLETIQQQANEIRHLKAIAADRLREIDRLRNICT